MGPGAGLGVPLKAHDRLAFKADALHRAVKQRAICDPCRRGQAALVERKAMVLAADERTTAVDNLDRMIGAPMAGPEFDDPCSAGQAQQLVAQANTENRQALADQLSGKADAVFILLRMPRPVGQQPAEIGRAAWREGE